VARRGSGLAALLAAAAMILTGLHRPGVAQPTGPGGSSAPPVHAADFAAGAVACDHPLASEAGAAMLRDGGNAVDAAVAAAFTLSVVRPDSCGIGGGGFMLVHLPARDGEPARTIALDHRETAPAAMGPEYFLNLRDAGRPADVSRVGVHAAGVPGTVAGLLEAHERFGRLPRAKVMAPAIAIAREGWAADEHHASVAGELERRVIAAPHAMPRAAWIRDRLGQSGRIIAGERLRNPEQARALELIAADGAAAFYRGPIAEAIVQAMEAAGGPMTAEDLAGYRPREFEPVRGTYRGRTVLSMPPPSSGGTAILQALGILERLRPQGLEGRGPEDPRRIHALAESLKHAFADRAEWMADPDFVTVPLEQLLAAGTLDAAAARVDPERTFPPTAYGTDMPPPIDGGTSHLSVVDASGMAVALTETINLAFGSLVPVAGRGQRLRPRAVGSQSPGSRQAAALEHVAHHRAGAGRDGRTGRRSLRRAADHHRHAPGAAARARRRPAAGRGRRAAAAAPSVDARRAGVRAGVGSTG
jgi:gamma-glutamyltranspeptidase/glutathione hydrolase